MDWCVWCHRFVKDTNLFHLQSLIQYSDAQQAEMLQFTSLNSSVLLCFKTKSFQNKLKQNRQGAQIIGDLWDVCTDFKETFGVCINKICLSAHTKNKEPSAVQLQYNTHVRCQDGHIWEIQPRSHSFRASGVRFFTWYLREKPRMGQEVVPLHPAVLYDDWRTSENTPEHEATAPATGN